MVDKVIAERFDLVISKGRNLLLLSSADPNRVPPEPFMEWKSQSHTLLVSIFGADHIYSTDFAKWTREGSKGLVQSGMGVLTAAAEDCAKGFTWELRERVHADIFDDYLEMAASLAEDGFTNAAAVIAGTTLEEHLRQLCQKNNIEVTVTKRNGSTEPKKASVMNDDLYKQSVYPQPEWRLIRDGLTSETIAHTS